jgi:hypothetical protein
MAKIDPTHGDLRVDGGRVFTHEEVLTVTAGAYSVDDVLGADFELANAARETGIGGVVMSVVASIEDNDADGFAADDIEIFFFKSAPAGTYTDNAALAITDADAAECEGAVKLDTKYDGGHITILQATNVNLAYTCDATSLYAVCAVRTAVTPEATDAIQLRIKLMRD